MRFQLQTDYALKALLYLTAHPGTKCTTEEIAALYQISAAHLGRVIRRLQKHGYVKAVRGRRGGVRLDRDPERLILGEVVETLEEGGTLFELGDDPSQASIDQSQRLRAYLRRARGMFINYLHQVSFAELAEEPGLVPALQATTVGEAVGSSLPVPVPEAAPPLPEPQPV